jgi:hypothetical protein
MVIAPRGATGEAMPRRTFLAGSATFALARFAGDAQAAAAAPSIALLCSAHRQAEEDLVAAAKACDVADGPMAEARCEAAYWTRSKLEEEALARLLSHRPANGREAIERFRFLFERNLIAELSDDQLRMLADSHEW